MRVFLSVGRIATDEHRQFLERLERKLRSQGLEPRTIGRNTFTAGQPLERIKDEMRESKGLLVVAFERTRVERGLEWRSDGEPSQFDVRRYSTPWHQIELAMACMLALPTFVILEKGVFEEGLLEDKYGWYVMRIPLKPEVLDSEEFGGILSDWIERSKKTREPEVDLGQRSIGELARSLRPAQAWAVLTALAVVLTGVFTLGHKSSVFGSKTAAAQESGKLDTSATSAPSSVSAPSSLAELKEAVAKAEKELLRVPEALVAAHRDLVGVDDAGMVKLLPRGRYENLMNMSGGGSYYSFTRRDHAYGNGSDISLEDNAFRVGFAGMNYGFFVPLGNVALAELAAAGKDPPGWLGAELREAWTFAWAHRPPPTVKEVRCIARSFMSGRRVGSTTLGQVAAARVGQSYLLRSLSFNDSDVLVALRTLKRDDDGSVFIGWRLLDGLPVPLASGPELGPNDVCP